MGQPHEFDVVVVGSGIAGLSSAISALESGARVAIIERSTPEESGGNTRYTEAFLRMASQEKPSDDLEDRLLGDHMGHPDPGILADAMSDRSSWSQPMRTLDVADGEIVMRLGEQAPATLDWLTGHGIRFDALPTPFLTQAAPRMSPVGGGWELVKTLTARAQELGAQYFYETTALSLVLDDDHRVVGVRTNPAGVLRGNVVLACGGFEGNPEMLARYMGPTAINTRPVARGGHYNKGEGIEMALAAGAAGAGNFSLFHAEPIDPRSGVAEAAIFAFPYGILVNQEGSRFVDEAPGTIDAWYERITRRIHAQADGVAWWVYDQRGASVPNISVGIRTDQPPVSAATVGELAQRIGVPADALVATVEAYNAACPDESGFDHSRPDGLATSGLGVDKSNWSRPIVEGPFLAYPIIAANVFTFGGLRIDADARVVDRSGSAIPGLWAAGEITGMYYTNYTGSTSVLRGAVFGRIAGAGAAAKG
ncbi:MAG: FAD-dependent oxidoreductase [Actinobacteria bacterium]|nr:FAD-dependent oxidoreductase [Actinomycetota bacterium]